MSRSPGRLGISRRVGKAVLHTATPLGVSLLEHQR